MMSVLWSADTANSAARAPAKFFQQKPDGSGIVTLDMSGVYGVGAGGKTGAKPSIRSLGIDFSGACGAPALLAVVDSTPGAGFRVCQRKDYTHGSEVLGPGNDGNGRHPYYAVRSALTAKREQAAELKAAQEVDADTALDKRDAAETEGDSDDGAKKRQKQETDYSLWQWVTHADNKVSAGTNRFTITAPNGATLTATVMCPAKCTVMVHEENGSTEFNYHYDHQGGSYPRKVVRIEGLNEFFVVMTIQKGHAPGVQVSEGGLSAAKAVVGGRTVRFDGSNVVFE